MPLTVEKINTEQIFKQLNLIKMSNFKFFSQYKNELKTLSKVVNRFDFVDFANRLLENDCKGNYFLFDKIGNNNVLNNNKTYAFVSFAIDHIYVNGGKIEKDKTSELQFVNFIKVLFELSPIEKTIKVRGQYDTIEKKQVWENTTQIGYNNLFELWNKATKAKAAELEKAAKAAEKAAKAAEAKAAVK